MQNVLRTDLKIDCIASIRKAHKFLTILSSDHLPSKHSDPKRELTPRGQNPVVSCWVSELKSGHVKKYFRAV